MSRQDCTAPDPLTSAEPERQKQFHSAAYICKHIPWQVKDIMAKYCPGHEYSQQISYAYTFIVCNLQEKTLY